MKITPTSIPDLFVLEPRVFGDDRGYFFESFNKNVLKDNGLNYAFVQDNESKSKFGVLRGLHYQLGEMAQAKLVRVLSGKVLDVAVDLRKNSPTFGQHFSIELSAENKKQLLVPRGFAHGFSVLSEEATFFYKCDNFYSKESEGGIIFNDPMLKIDWKLADNEAIVSEKDKILPNFENAKMDF